MEIFNREESVYKNIIYKNVNIKVDVWTVINGLIYLLFSD